MTPIFLKNVLTFNGQSLLYPKKQRIRSKKGFFIFFKNQNFWRGEVEKPCFKKQKGFLKV